MMCLGVFIIAEALGRTQLSIITPEMNSENLLALLTPLVAIFGVAFFLTLLNQMNVPTPQVRYGVIALLAVIVCQPLIGTLVSKTSPVTYPPYYPPEIQTVSGWMHQDELMMSDIPWAVAWYGDRQCTWTTLNTQPDFYAINDYLKPVKGIYFTTEFMDKKVLSETVNSDDNSWGHFVFNLIEGDIRRQQGSADVLSHINLTGEDQNNYLKGFPLRKSKTLSAGFFFTDQQRWPNQ
jgi:hypothetical protein